MSMISSAPESYKRFTEGELSAADKGYDTDWVRGKINNTKDRQFVRKFASDFIFFNG
jgi:hypothetical protein